MPKRPKGEGGRPPEHDTDPSKTGVESKPDTDPEKTGVSKTDTGDITQDVEGVEIDETLVSVPSDAERTAVRRPQTGPEIVAISNELDLAEEDESGENELVELPVHRLDPAQTRALSQAGDKAEEDQTDPGRKLDAAQRRMRFQELWGELAKLAGKEIEQKLFIELEKRRKAGEDVGVLLTELERTVANRRELAAAAEPSTADLPADEVVGQGDYTLDSEVRQVRQEVKREIRRARTGAKPAPTAEDPGATQVVRKRKRRPESTEIIPPKPKPQPKKTSWLEKLKFWK